MNASLAESYLIKATKRLKILAVLLDDEAYSDAIREAQEAVELACKGMLRHAAIEPPHWHDVGDLLREYRGRFPPSAEGAIQLTRRRRSLKRRARRLGVFDRAPVPAVS